MKDKVVEKHRRSIRLKGYDYRQAGTYFVTICTKSRACLFGAVDGEIQLNNVGRIIHATWNELPGRFPNLQIDGFIVMPKHIHGLLIVGAQFIAPPSLWHDDHNAKPGAINRAPTLGEIVRSYKAASTHIVRSTVNSDFAWQRNYYEHIIRNDECLNRIRQYINDNPGRWKIDRENPAATNPEPQNAWRVNASQVNPKSINLLRR